MITVIGARWGKVQPHENACWIRPSIMTHPRGWKPLTVLNLNDGPKLSALLVEQLAGNHKGAGSIPGSSPEETLLFSSINLSVHLHIVQFLLWAHVHMCNKAPIYTSWTTFWSTMVEGVSKRVEPSWSCSGRHLNKTRMVQAVIHRSCWVDVSTSKGITTAQSFMTLI